MSRAEPLIRQWNLLKSLQAFHFGQTAEELATRLECSKRQVQRDLGVLQLVGFPLFHDTRDGGKRYWRMESHALEHGGLTLSTTEMLSLYLSQQLLTPLAGTQFGDGLGTLLEKIKALLPKKALGYFLDESNLLVKSLPRHDYSGQDKEITILNHAIHEGRVLNIRYQSASKGKPSDATFHPYGLVFLHGSLYCIGHLVEYDEIRTLKVSRFLGVQMTNKTFQRPASFSLSAYTQGAFGIFRSGKLRTIRVKFTGWAATSIRELQWHASQRIVKDAAESVIAEFKLSDTTEFKRWLLGFGRYALVLQPKDLAADVAQELTLARAAYR